MRHLQRASSIISPSVEIEHKGSYDLKPGRQALVGRRRLLVSFGFIVVGREDLGLFCGLLRHLDPWLRYRFRVCHVQVGLVDLEPGLEVIDVDLGGPGLETEFDKEAYIPNYLLTYLGK